MKPKSKYYTLEQQTHNIAFLGEFENFQAAFEFAEKKTKSFGLLVLEEESLKQIILEALGLML